MHVKKNPCLKGSEFTSFIENARISPEEAFLKIKANSTFNRHTSSRCYVIEGRYFFPYREPVVKLKMQGLFLNPENGQVCESSSNQEFSAKGSYAYIYQNAKGVTREIIPQ